MILLLVFFCLNAKKKLLKNRLNKRIVMKIKIRCFITHFPYQGQLVNQDLSEVYPIGGGEKVAYNLIRELSRRGHKIEVFTTSFNDKESVEVLENGNIRIFRFGKNLRIGSTNISFKLVLESIKCEHHDDIDVVHIHNTTAPGVIAGIIYAKRRRKPIVITHHGAERFSNFGSISRRIGVYIYTNFMIDKIFSIADVIILPSKYYLDDSKYLKKYRDKIKIIPNGINLKEYNVFISKEECRRRLGLPVDKDIILFLGALIPKKGPHILLKAMSEVVKKYPNAFLILVGSGMMRKDLEKLSQKLGIKKNIKFTGFIEERLKPFYYKASDIFVLPSIIKTEVFPLTLLEASASGLPLITSDLNTFKCIVEENFNGLFARRGDERDLANKILYLLENKDVRRKLGNNAKKKALNFSWDKIAKETEKVYMEVMNNEY